MRLERILVLLLILTTVIALGFPLSLWARLLAISLHVGGWIIFSLFGMIDHVRHTDRLQTNLQQSNEAYWKLHAEAENLEKKIRELNRSHWDQNDTLGWLLGSLTLLREEIRTHRGDANGSIMNRWRSWVELAMVVMELYSNDGAASIQPWSESHPWRNLSGGVFLLMKMGSDGPLDYERRVVVNRFWAKELENDSLRPE